MCKRECRPTEKCETKRAWIECLLGINMYTRGCAPCTHTRCDGYYWPRWSWCADSYLLVRSGKYWFAVVTVCAMLFPLAVASAVGTMLAAARNEMENLFFLAQNRRKWMNVVPTPHAHNPINVILFCFAPPLDCHTAELFPVLNPPLTLSRVRESNEQAFISPNSVRG